MRSLFSHGGCQAGLKCDGEGPLHFCSPKPKRGDYPLILSRESFSLHNYFPPSQSLTLASSPWKASCPLTPSSAQPTPSLWQLPSSFQRSLRVSSFELFLNHSDTVGYSVCGAALFPAYSVLSRWLLPLHSPPLSTHWCLC